MLMAQPLACLSVITPDTVLWLICSNEVQVELYRSVQLPLEDQVTPAARNCDAACDWVSLVTASAEVLTLTRVPALASRAANRTRMRFPNIDDYPQQLVAAFPGLQPPAP